MNEWTNEWVSEYVNEWKMNEWVNEWVNEWMNEWMNEGIFVHERYIMILRFICFIFVIEQVLLHIGIQIIQVNYIHSTVSYYIIMYLYKYDHVYKIHTVCNLKQWRIWVACYIVYCDSFLFQAQANLLGLLELLKVLPEEVNNYTHSLSLSFFLSLSLSLSLCAYTLSKLKFVRLYICWNKK